MDTYVTFPLHAIHSFDAACGLGARPETPNALKVLQNLKASPKHRADLLLEEIEDEITPFLYIGDTHIPMIGLPDLLDRAAKITVKVDHESENFEVLLKQLNGSGTPFEQTFQQ